MKHIMIDLETVNNKADAAIVSIGAVVFDENEIKEEFHINVNTDSCVGNGMSIDHSTLCWWMEQSREARLQAFRYNAVDLITALTGLSSFIEEPQNSQSDVVMWGNGAAFDNAILSLAYDRVKLVQPWCFWNDMCYRTISKLSGIKREQKGTHHNALEDAKSQALHLIEINKACPQFNIFGEEKYK